MLTLLAILLGAGVSPPSIMAEAKPAWPVGVEDIDTSWHTPAKTQVNNLMAAIHSKGVYGFIYNSSNTPDVEYGTYNWCNMPHVRPLEYVRPDKEFELRYVELAQRHHKRTCYASNAFPIEPDQWNCDDAHLFIYGQPLQGKDAAPVFRQGYTSPNNPFVPSGWVGSCSFPQITAGGLRDSWQHGSDLYAVYHGLLGFLPAKSDDYISVVRYRVTNNIITSQVAGMVINGMWSTSDPFPLLVQAVGVDSLEPQYPCSTANYLFNSIKSNSNPDWKEHLELSNDLFHALDDISGVPSDDGGFHASFDHYYDNLSARQCHDKPSPCKLTDGPNSTSCVSQALADSVYRMGNWEYSHIYRDHPLSLPASVLSLGVWIGELAQHLREVMEGQSKIRYFHNIAHDGSVSRLLSILQIDEMVWPGMGSEVVFELYERKSYAPTPRPTGQPEVGRGCNRDNCLRYMIRNFPSLSTLCHDISTPPNLPQPTILQRPSQCPNQSRLSSACACLPSPASAEATPTAKKGNASRTSLPSPSGFYVRVLFSGKVLKSSSPTLGSIDMLPVEVLLDYLDGLVGKGGNLIKTECQA